MTDALIAWLHYAGFMVMFAALVAEHLLFDDIAPVVLARRLSLLNAMFCVALLVVFATGMIKVTSAQPGAAWYMQNWVFHTKLMVFFLVALVSVWPTIHFLRGRRKMAEGAAQVTYPRLLKMAIRIEMLGLLLLPLLAAMMARGIGSI